MQWQRVQKKVQVPALEWEEIRRCVSTVLSCASVSSTSLEFAFKEVLGELLRNRSRKGETSTSVSNKDTRTHGSECVDIASCLSEMDETD